MDGPLWAIEATLPPGLRKAYLARAEQDWEALGRQSSLLYNSAVKLGAEAPQIEHALSGRFYVSYDSEDRPWGLVAVPNALGRGAFDALNTVGVELPKDSHGGAFNAHITVLHPADIEHIGGPAKISERGHSFKYTLGPVKSVSPDGWPEVSKCWFIEVHSPELKDFRKSYGLSALPKGDHPFHITFAVRKRSVLRPNTVTKAAAEGEPPEESPRVVPENKLASLLLEGHPVTIDRPKGYKKTFTNNQGPIVKEYPTDYGYLDDRINPEDDEEVDVFLGSNGRQHGRFMKGNTLEGPWKPDETKWYANLNRQQLAAVKEMFQSQHPELLADFRQFKSRQELLLDILASTRPKTADFKLTSGIPFLRYRKKRRKEEDEHSFLPDAAVGLGAIGAAGTGLGYAMSSDKDVAESRNAIKQHERPLEQGETPLLRYIDTMTQLAPRKIFGVPAGDIVAAVRSTPLPGQPVDKGVANEAKAHYSAFQKGPLAAYFHQLKGLRANKGWDVPYKAPQAVGNGSTDIEARADGLRPNDFLHRYMDSETHNAMINQNLKFIGPAEVDTTGIPRDEQMQMIRKAYKKLPDWITRDTEQPGTAVADLLSSNFSRYKPIAETAMNIRDTIKNTGITAGGAGLGMLAGHYLHKALRDDKENPEKDSRQDDGAYQAATWGGAGLGGLGAFLLGTEAGRNALAKLTGQAKTAQVKEADWTEWFRQLVGMRRRDKSWKDQPASDHVAKMRYELEPEDLYVTYRGKGDEAEEAEYAYHGVPYATADSIRSADNVGKAIWDKLRVRGSRTAHKFPYERVS